MTEASPQNPPQGAPPAGDGNGSVSTPPPATRPDWLPEAHWDDQSKAMKPEFGAHYAELANFHKAQTEAQAALETRKPEDIKIELKLPDTVKVPQGLELKIDEKDPRVPALREMAVKHRWSQETVDALIAFEAQQKIAGHTAEMERVAAEDKKLGDNGKARKDAISTWAKGLRDRNEITAEEFEEIRQTVAFAAGVSLLEKLMAKASGTVPGHQPNPNPNPNPQPKSAADRIWPNGFSTQAKAG